MALTIRQSGKRAQQSAVVTARPDNPGGFTHRQVLIILSGLVLGMFMAALDQTITATAVRTIADDLSGYSLQAWVTTAYLITATLTTPLYGKLSDMYGRRPFLLAAIVIFVGGSLLCTVAQSMYELAVFRAIQGVGAGGLMSLASAVLGDIVSPRERARYQGHFLATWALASVIGPVLGGVFAGQHSILGVTGWRWVFLVNVPVGLIALVVVYRVVRIPRVNQGRVAVDWLGTAAFAIGITPILIVAEQGRSWGWTSAGAVSCYLIGALGVIAFVAIEARMGDAALIPLRLFRNRTFAMGVAIALVVGAALFGGIILVPQYLQVVRGASPVAAGLQLLPMVVGLLVGSAVSNRLISRTGRYRIFPIAGTAAVALGLFLFHYLTPDTPLWRTMIFMAITGIGLGNLLQPITLAIQNAAAPADMGVSSAAATFFRQVGGTLGVAALLSTLFGLLPSRVDAAVTSAGTDPAYRQAVVAGLHSANPADVAFAQGLARHDPAAVQRIFDDSSLIQRLDPTLAAPLQTGFADAMSTVYLVSAGLAVLALVLVLCWKEIPLRESGGLDR
ncbi:DHA2 family efflux MFS transporter permease subunit [Nocardia brasiliensis]|uniref:DHA2 family efflux MFS transporter permease subunit n=1 Tax=Nocardia brasiliensis TaxID=37326 RepID=A0A6G9XLT9_NOCBR|nr:MDR family MFS transporter [Nocardia brasiliensis]QIS01874.1 DHA2 family efflux MFS transporter permease subunit [Nocardia brasiliensis]